MALFSSPTSFLGIDLGAGGIKLVELRDQDGRPRLVTYGHYELPLEAGGKDNDWSKREDEAVRIIKQLLEQTKAESRLVVSALPTFNVFSSMISVPAVSDKELANVIRLEAKKVIPRPLEEMTFDWKEIGGDGDAGQTQNLKQADTREESEGENKEKQEQRQERGKITGAKQSEQKRILITAAPKELVRSYLQIFQDAGLKIVGLETEAIALSRALVGRDPSVVMMVDIGAKTTNLSIVEEGIAVVNRGVNFGGHEITRKMAERMQLDAKDTEQWKRDLGIALENGNLSPVVKEILDDLLHEVEYMFQLYRSQFRAAVTNGGGVEKIVLAGGSAFVPGLAEYLAQELDVPVHLGDPWARVIYPEDLSPVLSELAPSMAVSVGLAMREIVSS